MLSLKSVDFRAIFQLTWTEKQNNDKILGIFQDTRVAFPGFLGILQMLAIGGAWLHSLEFQLTRFPSSYKPLVFALSANFMLISLVYQLAPFSKNLLEIPGTVRPRRTLINPLLPAISSYSLSMLSFP